MEKKYKQHLFITVFFAIVVGFTLFYMYDNFKFQTYSDVVYYDYILSGKNKLVTVNDLEVYCNQDQFYIGKGQVTINDVIEGTISMQLILKSNDKEYSYDYSYENGQNFTLNEISLNSKEIYTCDIKSAKFKVLLNGETYSTVSLKLNPVSQLECSNKEYRIVNASVTSNLMHLGSIISTNEDIIKEYPNVSLEYRYLKDNKGDKDDNDNYVVFKKIVGNSNDIVNGDELGTYYLDDDSFDGKELSVVVIFSNDKDKYAFSIDLIVRQVGDYYG